MILKFFLKNRKSLKFEKNNLAFLFKNKKLNKYHNNLNSVNKNNFNLRSHLFITSLEYFS